MVDVSEVRWRTCSIPGEAMTTHGPMTRERESEEEKRKMFIFVICISKGTSFVNDLSFTAYVSNVRERERIRHVSSSTDMPKKFILIQQCKAFGRFIKKAYIYLFIMLINVW